MKTWITQCVSVMTSFVLFICFLSCSAQIAYAQNVTNCMDNFGQDVPVLMVHGLNSSQDTWVDGSTTMFDALEPMSDIGLDRFDYSQVNNEWITNNAIGPALAKRIDCLAQASMSGGGAGKVIVVAHSMGGLATRYAASQVIDGRKVSDSIGLVITLGTPHLGSGYGTTCMLTSSVPGECRGTAPVALAEGSNELSALSKFPAGIPVRAIAGHVTLQRPFLYATVTRDMQGDKVVGVKSATNEYTETGHGDGVRVYACYGSLAWPNNDASCEHNRMLGSPYVQEGVSQGIQEYLDSRSERINQSGRKITLFNKLTINYLDTWEGAQSMPGQVENIVDYSLCKDIAAKCPHIFIANLDSNYGMTTYGNNPLVSITKTGCTQSTTTEPSPLQLVETFDIDGEAADYYIQNCSIGQQAVEVMHYWYVENRGVMVATKNMTAGEVSLDNLRAVLRKATWQ